MNKTLLKEGDVIELREGHEVYTKIPNHFLYQNMEGDWNVSGGQVTIGKSLLFLKGKYIVTSTSFDGGGSTFDGGYPDGHHVFCVKADNPKIKVDFYQTGSFTAMIEDITPIGRAIAEWKLTSENL